MPGDRPRKENVDVEHAAASAAPAAGERLRAPVLPHALHAGAPGRVATVLPWRFCTTPWLTRIKPATNATGSRTRVVALIRSAQKFPIVGERRRTIPRTRARATAIPTAADTKFCTARPTIWVRWLTVFSPA